MKIQLNTDVHNAGTGQAVHGATQKLKHLLYSKLGRLQDNRDNPNTLIPP